MKILKKILGVLLLIGGLGSVISFFSQLNNYDSSDATGHLIAIVIVFGLAYLCLKPSNKKEKS